MNKTFIALALALMCASTVYTTCNASAIETLLTSVNADDANSTQSDDETTYPTLTISETSSADDIDEEGVCGAIWTEAGGSCCVQSEIADRVQALEERLKTRMEARLKTIETGVESVLGDASELSTTLTAQSENLVLMKNSASASGRILTTGDGADEDTVAQWQATIDEITEGSADDEERAQKAIDGLGACVKQLLDNRIKTWCLACAQEGTYTFWDDSTDTVLVSEETCEVIVDKCAEPIAFMTRLVQLDAIKREINLALGGTEGETIDVIETADLTATIECGDDASTCASTDESRQSFCGQIPLNKDTTALYGDDSLGELSVGSFPEPTASDLANLATGATSQGRILATDDSNGYAVESSNGVNYQDLDSGYESDIDAANIVQIAFVLMMAFFSF